MTDTPDDLVARSFFNADDLSLLIMEHLDAPQFLAVKIADEHDAAMAKSRSRIEALESRQRELIEVCDDLLKAIDAGRMRQRVGVTGQTMDAQLRASVYDAVPAYPVEEAREKYNIARAALAGDAG